MHRCQFSVETDVHGSKDGGDSTPEHFHVYHVRMVIGGRSIKNNNWTGRCMMYHEGNSRYCVWMRVVFAQEDSMLMQQSRDDLVSRIRGQAGGLNGELRIINAQR